MFRFVGRFTKLKIDRRKWTAAMHTQMNIAMHYALKEWLIAVIERVPVYTGMARGTLRPIGRFISELVPFDIEINPRPEAKKYPHKTPEAGDAAAIFRFHNEEGRVYVSFDPNVLHYHILERFGHPNVASAPWHSMEAGREAYRAWMRANLKDFMPQITEFITKTEVIVDGGG